MLFPGWKKQTNTILNKSYFTLKLSKLQKQTSSKINFVYGEREKNQNIGQQLS